MEITTIGLDLAKNVFQVHAMNGVGEVVVRKALRRAQVLRFFERLAPCLVGIERAGRAIIGLGRSEGLVTRYV